MGTEKTKMQFFTINKISFNNNIEFFFAFCESLKQRSTNHIYIVINYKGMSCIVLFQPLY